MLALVFLCTLLLHSPKITPPIKFQKICSFLSFSPLSPTFNSIFLQPICFSVFFFSLLQVVFYCSIEYKLQFQKSFTGCFNSKKKNTCLVKILTLCKVNISNQVFSLPPSSQNSSSYISLFFLFLFFLFFFLNLSVNI